MTRRENDVLGQPAIEEMLSLVGDVALIQAQRHMEALAHGVMFGPKRAATESGVPYVTIAGSDIKSEDMCVVGGATVAEGNPLVVTQENVGQAAAQAMRAWIDGACNYRKTVCSRAGAGAHIVLVWRDLPEFMMWSDWQSHSVRIALRARLAFETIESVYNYEDFKPVEPPVDFLALNKDFAR